MPHSLYLFLEGHDDERFFSRVLSRLLRRRYSNIQVILYAEDPPKVTRRFVRSIRSAGDDYIFAKDIDEAPCVTESKRKAINKFQVDENNIIIVIKEIECWYLCGLGNQSCEKLRIDRLSANTDSMTKEDFDELIPKDMSRIEFMQQILERYDIPVGRSKNRSFRYFLEKWVDS